MSTFGEIREPVARKKHHCEWCPEKIKPGEKYSRFVGMWDGDFQNWAMHKECLDAHRKSEADSPYNDGEICIDGHVRGEECDH